MTTTDAGMIVLAFQVWDAVGWVGQALFTGRVLIQWLASERAGRSVVPRSFWWISLAGSLAPDLWSIVSPVCDFGPKLPGTPTRTG